MCRVYMKSHRHGAAQSLGVVRSTGEGLVGGAEAEAPYAVG